MRTDDTGWSFGHVEARTTVTADHLRHRHEEHERRALRCYCPGDCACRPRFTGDYRAECPPCGCRQHEAGNVSAAYIVGCLLALLPGTLVAFVLGALAGAASGVA